MRALRIILLALAFITLQAHAKDDGRNLVVKQNASVGKRIALVIGNGNYQSDNLPKLANPTHDAERSKEVERGRVERGRGRKGSCSSCFLNQYVSRQPRAGI